jgi:hypothetical protein
MQTTGARRLRADDQRRTRPARRLHLVEAETSPSYASQLETRSSYTHEGRRTVVITGQPVPARRRVPRTQAQIQARPDRIALWAVGLGLLLVFMAVATANAAPA